jgi:putative ABC transport system permease protein
VARALGLTPRLLRRTARWASLAFATAALVVGVPIGLVAGRVIWRTYAEGLGVVADPVIAPWEIVAVVGATVLLALLVGTLAARRQARILPGTVLRSE